MSEFSSVAALLARDGEAGGSVAVRGWLRSKRDSKAGISFLAVHDGSAFDAIQAVVPAELPNYENEVRHLTTGCAVEVRGELVPSQGKGQSVEIQASEVRVIVAAANSEARNRPPSGWETSSSSQLTPRLRA